MNDGIKMQISAFVDGELPEAETQLLLRRLSQDAELRQQAAEYFAVGRAMRGQRSIAGASDLRGRIAAAVDDRLIDMEFEEIEPAARRYTRPLAGIAIAATVAVAAIFGLQLQTPDNGIDAATSIVAGDAAEDAYTVPEVDYFQRHNQMSSDAGNNNFDFRRVSADVDEELLIEEEREEIDPPRDTAATDSAE